MADSRGCDREDRGGGKVTIEEAIKIIKSECFVFNPLNFDRTRLINTALDKAVEALEQQKRQDEEAAGTLKDIDL